MSRTWVALILLVLVWCSASAAPTSAVREGAKRNAALIKLLLQKLRLPTGPKPLHTYTQEEEAERVNVMNLLTFLILEGSAPYVRQVLEDVLALLQNEDGRSEELLDAAYNTWSWLRDVESLKYNYNSFTSLLQVVLGSAAYGRLLRWLVDIGRRVKVSKEIVNSAKTLERFVALCLNPLLETFVKALLDDFPSFVTNVCNKFLHQASGPQVDEHDFPGLVEHFCVIFSYEDYQDEHPPASTQMVEMAVYSLTVVDKVVRRTECIEKALCIFDQARTWFSSYPVKIALVIANKTGLLNKLFPLRIQIAFRTLAWEVKGELCCSFFTCDITVFLIDLCDNE